jgi:hypothetical protein
MNNSPVLRLKLILVLSFGLAIVFYGLGCAGAMYYKEEPSKRLEPPKKEEKGKAETPPPAPAPEAEKMKETSSTPPAANRETQEKKVENSKSETARLDAEIEKLKKVESPSAPELKEKTKADAGVAKNKEELLRKIRELESSKKGLKSESKSAGDKADFYYEELREGGDLELSKKSSAGIKSLDRGTPLYVVDTDAKRRARAASLGASASSVRAGSHNDNEEFPFYQDYCSRYGDPNMPYPWKISERYVVKVTDKDSSPVLNESVVISDKSGKQVFSAKTLASGEFVLFPLMDLENYKSITDYSIAAGGVRVPIVKGKEDRISVTLPSRRQFTDTVSVQVCFLLDATGSMSDEIRQLQDVIFSIHSRLLSLPSRPRLSFSVVAYRDKGDEFVVKGFRFTSNIDSFQTALESIRANGGGDYPEEMERGLYYCLDSLSWNPASLKFMFPMGDAPPHLDKKERNYLQAARLCRAQGIMVCPIGASGLKSDGEFVYRQLAVVTHGEFVFLHYGEQGESDGSATEADPGKVSHHTGSNYTVRRLDDIVVGIVSNELGYCTPANLITHEFPKPAEESDLLETRMLSLLRQVIRPGTSLKGKALVLSPVAVSDTSLSSLSEYIWELSLENLHTVTDATVIERQRLQEILKEHALSLSGVTEPAQEAELGKILNADYMLLSKLHYLGAVRMCHMRLVDCKTGNIMGAARVKL